MKLRYSYELHPRFEQEEILLGICSSLQWIENLVLGQIYDRWHLEVPARLKKKELEAQESEFSIDQRAYEDAIRYKKGISSLIRRDKWNTNEGLQAIRSMFRESRLKMRTQCVSSVIDEIAQSIHGRIKDFLCTGNLPRFARSIRSIRLNQKRVFRIIGNYIEFSMFEIAGIRSRIKFNLHRPLPAPPSSAVIARKHGRWIVSFVVEAAELPEAPNKAIGIDRGVTNLIADSDGTIVPGIKNLYESEIFFWKRRVSARIRGSKNYQKALNRLNFYIRKQSNYRKTLLHTLSKKYTDQYRTIVVEDLKIAKMTASARGTMDSPGTNVAQKSGLNRSILEQGWSMFARMCEAKARRRHGVLRKIQPRYTSQKCRKCGCVDAENRVAEKFRCLSCGHQAHADVNAAGNILDIGMSGDIVVKRPPKRYSIKSSSKTTLPGEITSQDKNLLPALPSSATQEGQQKRYSQI